MNSTQCADCPHTHFTPYRCQLLPQSNKSFKFPCIVNNIDGCQVFKEHIPPKNLQLNTVSLVSINVYNITYHYKDNYYYGETYPALNYTISLPNGDMLGSCLAVRVNIWNNETNSGYGGDGICRLFTFNIRKLSKKNIQPAFINHKCFTATTANNYFLKFTTLPYAAEITYSIIINKPNQIILAVAPVHHRLSISIVLGFPVTNKCNNQFYLISYKTATEKVSFSTNNSFLFENLQPGFFRVRVKSSCLPTGQNMESEIILLKNISESETLFNTKIIWVGLPLLASLIFLICSYRLWKRKCIDRSHKCVIDLVYAVNNKRDMIVAENLKKLMEEEFEWHVNSIPMDNTPICSCELPTNDVVLYLTASDMQGRVRFPQVYKNIQDLHPPENINMINALLYYTQKNSHIQVDFHPSFDIVKDIKKLFYFVYRATKSNSEAGLFNETHFPSVNYIEKLKFWKKFVNLIEDIDEYILQS